jgi:hypothetical protein
MNHLFAVLYPTAKEAVPTKSDLPLTGNSIGDMRVVINDGDNKSASYRFELREGDTAPGTWYKIYDLDFSSDSILASWQNVTQDQYVQKRGRDDIDVNGNPVTGLLSGQAIYGGKSANTNLNLYANSGDGNGPSTGYIQAGDNVRPLWDDAISLGEISKRFKEVHTLKAFVDKFTISDDTITSSSGIIDGVDCDIITDGRLEASHIIAEDVASQLASGTLIGDLSLGNGYVISDGGTISFGGNNLVTTGDSHLGSLNIVGNQIDSDNNVIDFNANDLVDINSVDAALGIYDSLEVGLGANTLEIGTDGNLTKSTGLLITTPSLQVSGFLEVLAGLSAVQDIEAGGVVKSSTSVIATDQTEAKYVSLEGGEFGNRLTSIGNHLDINAELGVVLNAPVIKPLGIASDLGNSTQNFRDIYFHGALILDSGTALDQEKLEGLRNIIVKSDGSPAQDGDTLFWSSAQQCWFADHPDTEITHSQISGLYNDDHLQYVNLSGRSSGQVIFGAITPVGNLTLASTQNAAKGFVLFRDVLAPETDGTNIGTASRQIGDSYHKGQAIGLRAENTTTVTLPSASAAKAGRIIYDATAKTILVDDGGTWRRCGAEKFIVQDDLYWDGSAKTKTYTIGSSLQDAAKAIWEFSLTSTGEKLYPTITRTSTQVTVTFKAAPPAASYTLIGVA